MAQPNPPDQVLRDGQDIPQHVYLKFIKRLIYCSLQQCLKLVQSIFNLQSRLWVLDISIIIRVGDRIGRGVRESQALGGSSKKAGLKTRYRLVDEVVYRVDYVVDEGLNRENQNCCTTTLAACFVTIPLVGKKVYYVCLPEACS